LLNFSFISCIVFFISYISFLYSLLCFTLDFVEVLTEFN
jgi:hypothetical protein